MLSPDRFVIGQLFRPSIHLHDSNTEISMMRIHSSAVLAIAALLAGAGTTRAATTSSMMGVGGCVAPEIVQGLQSVILCAGDHVTLSVVASGTNLSYDWYHGTVLTNYHSASIDFPLVTFQDRGLWCVQVSNSCGSASSCARISINQCGGLHCTLTQGAYGNPNGQFGGQSRLELVEELLSEGPIVIGEAGRSVTFEPDAATAQSICSRLPAGSAATTLPDFGDQSFNSFSGNTNPPLPLKGGRFKNILFGQTLTLALNLRLDPSLASVNLCSSTLTSGGTITIDPAVLSRMFELGFGHNAGGLLGFANHALAGGTDLGSVTLAGLSNALTALNEGFDECRTFIGCN
jgi:hypothetical protein